MEIDFDPVPDASGWMWLVGTDGAPVGQVMSPYNHHPDFQMSLLGVMLGYLPILSSSVFDFGAAANINNGIIMERLLKRQTLPASLFRDWMEAVRKRVPNSPSVVGDGSCLYRTMMPTIQKIFPNSKVCAALRVEQWDMVASQKDRWQRYNSYPEDDADSLSLRSLRYQMQVMAELRQIISDFPSQFIPWYWDDFLISPVETLRSDFSLIGIDPDDYDYSGFVPQPETQVIGDKWKRDPDICRLKDRVEAGLEPVSEYELKMLSTPKSF